MSKQFKFLDAYSPIFWEDKTYWIVSGGRASGKSTNVAAYFLLKLMAPEYARLVIARYTQRALTNSIYRDIVDLITQWNLGSFLTINGDEIICKNPNKDGSHNMIITHSLKLQEGTMSARGKGLARVTHLLIDEATELPSEEEYLKLIDSFRTKGAERKIFLLFNPTSKSSWIFRRFYLPDGSPNPKYTDTHGYIHTTYKDNEHNLDPSKVREWEQSLYTDPEYYSHHILGKWADQGEGNIFKTWIWDNWNPEPDAEVLYGIDWGFSSDPSVVVRLYKKGKKIWVEELIYERGYTNDDLADRMKALGIPLLATIYADSAEPKSIETLRRLGYRNVVSAQKGPDSVRAGINKLLTYQVFANPASKNLVEEYYNYAWRPGTDKPIDAWNHAMDSIRYAMTGVREEGPRYAVMGRAKRQFDEF